MSMCYFIVVGVLISLYIYKLVIVGFQMSATINDTNYAQSTCIKALQTAQKAMDTGTLYN